MPAAADAVRAAYTRRAVEYTELLGSLDAVHAEDRRLIRDWACRVPGPVLDAGCGPGHWTAFLAEQGVEVSGIDQVEPFVEGARRRFPGVEFRVGRLETIPRRDGALGGVLAWYSLIHLPPADVPAVLREFARVLRPGGGLLLGLFDGTPGEAFDHAVATAYRWDAETIGAVLDTAGFDSCGSSRRAEPETRPHLAVEARRRA